MDNYSIDFHPNNNTAPPRTGMSRLYIGESSHLCQLEGNINKLLAGNHIYYVMRVVSREVDIISNVMSLSISGGDLESGKLVTRVNSRIIYYTLSEGDVIYSISDNIFYTFEGSDISELNTKLNFAIDTSINMFILNAPSHYDIEGYNFDDQIQVTGEGLNISDQYFINDKKYRIVFTPTELLSNKYLNIIRPGSRKISGTVRYSIVEHAVGTGPSGVYTLDFNNLANGLSGGDNFDGNWDLYALTSGTDVDGFFKSTTSTTPSSSTGPSGPTVFGSSQNSYMYTERSGAYTNALFSMNTAYFEYLTEIEFSIYKYGNHFGNLFIDSYFNGSWDNIATIAPDDYNHSSDNETADIITLDVSNRHITEIRFRWDEATSYDADMAFGYIKLTSQSA